MLDQSCVNSWLAEFLDRLRKAFGSRLVFVGHHGSWARGEGVGDSDIDTIVVLDRVEPQDLLAYRCVIDSMPDGGQVASGVLNSVSEMRLLPPAGLLQCFHGCQVLHGSLNGIVECPGAADLVEDVRRKASDNMFTARHYLLYPHDLTQKVHVLQYPFKYCVYALQAWILAQTGQFTARKVDLLAALDDADDRLVIAVARDWQKTREDREARPRFYFELLERWGRKMLLRLGSVPVQDSAPGTSVPRGERRARQHDIIFVTGPYSADTQEGVERNIQKAIAVGRAVFLKGYYALVPQLLVRPFYVVGDPGTFGYESLMQFTLAIVPRCDGLLLYEHSPGADREWQLAESLGKPVYFDVSELPDRNGQ